MPDDPSSLDRLLGTATRTDDEVNVDPEEILIPGLTILCHPDPRRIGETAHLADLTAGRPAYLSRAEPAFAQPGDSRSRPLADPYLSRRPIRLTLDAEGDALTIDRRGTSTRLAVDDGGVADERRLPASSLARGRVLLLADRVALLLHLQDPTPDASTGLGLVGRGHAVAGVRRRIRQVMDLDVSVLVRGESGTGKELVARAIHRHGERRRGPFVPVNMGALPPSLAAAELFGAVRGAYTGADRARAGLFSHARGGTLFLDEIGEAPPEVQVLLLRALEEGEIRPVGGRAKEAVDARLIAATDADLEADVEGKRFRLALLHRLAGFQIEIPPLSERREDVGRLLLHFLRAALAETGELDRLEPPASGGTGDGGPVWLPAPLVARLALHSWPGNVRQLRNVAQQLVIASRGRPVLRADSAVERLLAHEEAPAIESEPTRRRPRASYRQPADVSEDELLAALADNRWRLQPTARQLGISRTSLYKLVDASPAIRKAGDLDRDEIEAARRRCGGDLDKMVDTLNVSKRGLVRRMRKLAMD